MLAKDYLKSLFFFGCVCMVDVADSTSHLPELHCAGVQCVG